MKKILCILLTLSLFMMTSVSFAEAFTLRNGIHFGDTLEEVKAKETLEIKSQTENELVTKSGVLANVDVDSVIYRFENNKLVSVLWEVVDSRNNFYPPMVFDDLNTALTAKYGKSDSTDTDSYFLVKGAAIEEMMELMVEDFSFMLGMLMGEAGPLKQCEWEIESQGNENVKIDLLYYQVAEEDFRVRLSYDLYTDEELEELKKQDQSDEQSIQNDL